MKSAANAPSPAAVVGGHYLVIIAGLVVGVLAFGRHFVAEHQRLSWYEGVLVWLGDAVALFWATVYLIRHTLLGVAPATPSRPVRQANPLYFLAVPSVLAGLGADLWVTLSLRNSEREAFAAARRTVGTIHGLSKYEFEERIAYTLHCRYEDANRVAHAAVFRLRDPDELPRLAPAAVRAVRAERLPAPVAVAYNPDRPAQSWLADLNGEDATRLHGFSLCVLVFQGLGAWLFLLMLGNAYKATGRLPWWYDLYAVWLLTVEAGFVVLFGTLTLMGLPFFWGDF